MGASPHEFSDICSGSKPGSTPSGNANPKYENRIPPVEIYKCGKAFQPLLTPKWIISTFIGCGVLFVALGVSLLEFADEVVEHEHDYTDDTASSPHGVNWFLINVEKDMAAPIYMYYEVTGFNQNHRRHRESRADGQMSGEEPLKISPEELEDDCNPWIETEGRVNYPCGLVAKTIFNDTYIVRIQEPKQSSFNLVELDQSPEAIVWKSDIVKKKFQQIDPEASINDNRGTHQSRLNMWITRMFPPVTCQQVDFSIPVIPVEVAERKEEDGVKGWVNVTDCRGYKSGNSRCNFVQGGKPFICNDTHRLVPQPHWGIQSPHFAVWMRAAGLDKTRKLWAVIHKPILAGSVINVTYVHRFPVKEFHGRKAVFITTASWMGGRSPGLCMGVAYLVLGSLCLLFGAFFLIRHCKNPRDLGDVNYLSWVPKVESDKEDVLDSIGG